MRITADWLREIGFTETPKEWVHPELRLTLSLWVGSDSEFVSCGVYFGEEQVAKFKTRARLLNFLEAIKPEEPEVYK